MFRSRPGRITGGFKLTYLYVCPTIWDDSYDCLKYGLKQQQFASQERGRWTGQRVWEQGCRKIAEQIHFCAFWNSWKLSQIKERRLGSCSFSIHLALYWYLTPIPILQVLFSDLYFSHWHGHEQESRFLQSCGYKIYSKLVYYSSGYKIYNLWLLFTIDICRPYLTKFWVHLPIELGFYWGQAQSGHGESGACRACGACGAPRPVGSLGGIHSHGASPIAGWWLLGVS